MKAIHPITLLCAALLSLTAAAAPHAEADAPAKLQRLDDGSWFVDFSRSAYGWLEVRAPEGTTTTSIVVRVGEKLTQDGRIDRKPGCSINYRQLTLTLKPGEWARLEIPVKKQHTHNNVVKMPVSIGEVTPFRAVEIDQDGPPIRRLGYSSLIALAASNSLGACHTSLCNHFADSPSVNR